MSTRGDIRVPESTVTGALIAGYFKDEDDAKKAITSLRDKGFLGDQIGVAMREDEIPKHEKWIADVRAQLGKTDEVLPETYETTHETFTGLGIEDRAAAHFDKQLDDGGVVVGVRCIASRADEVAKILENNDGDVAREAAEVPGGEPAVKPHMMTYTEPELTSEPKKPLHTAEPARPAEGRRIQLMGEMLRTQKDRIDRGEVRLRKETRTEHQTVNVPVKREEVIVERRPGTGQPTGPVGAEPKEIRIPVAEERARVEKEPVSLGEVDVQKREVTSTQPVSGEVKREELRVEKEGNVDEVVEDKTGKPKKAA